MRDRILAAVPDGGTFDLVKKESILKADRAAASNIISGRPAISAVKLWNEDQFAAAENAWQDLLLRSDANPLFMSWVWQFHWWQRHSKLLHSALAIYACYTSEGRLVAIAPFHIRKVNHRALLRGTRLELLGSTFRSRTGTFSEYLDFIVDRDYVDSFLDALRELLSNNKRWSDLVIGNVQKLSIAGRFAREQQRDLDCYLRETDTLVAHIANLPTHFDDYLSALNPSVRRKLWNHRKKLSSPKLDFVKQDGIGEFLSILALSHERRWGFSPYGYLRNTFYSDVAAYFAGKGQLRMSYLKSAGQIISLMFNVRIGDTEYNIQSGFDADAVPSGSPGYLHFGYVLEAAQASGVKRFNFLAGSGRHRDYKRDFLTCEEELATFQSVRSRPLAWLYRGYDRQFLSMVGGCVPYLGVMLDAPTLDIGTF